MCIYSALRVALTRTGLPPPLSQQQYRSLFKQVHTYAKEQIMINLIKTQNLVIKCVLSFIHLQTSLKSHDQIQFSTYF